jgi:hypothetical protein
MRKLSLCLLLTLCLAGHSLLAADFLSFAGGLGPGNILVNAGIGFGTPLYGKTVVPPLSASVDYLYAQNGLPMSFGAIMGLSTSELDFSYGNYGYTYSYSMFSLGARFGWHFNFGVDKLDTYGILTLGYIFLSSDAEYRGEWGLAYKPEPVSTGSFLFGVNVGARYFFTDMIGAYAEVGYSAFSFLSLGVTVKLGQAGAMPQRTASSATSTSSQRAAVDSKLVGMWMGSTTTSNDGYMVLTFQEDGQGSFAIFDENNNVISGFRITHSQNTITVPIEGESPSTCSYFYDEDDLIVKDFLGVKGDVRYFKLE